MRNMTYEELCVIVWKIVCVIFIAAILTMTAFVILSVIRAVTAEPEPETNERQTLSACLTCRMRRYCIDSVQHHDATDDCYEEEKK